MPCPHCGFRGNGGAGPLGSMGAVGVVTTLTEILRAGCCRWRRPTSVGGFLAPVSRDVEAQRVGACPSSRGDTSR